MMTSHLDLLARYDPENFTGVILDDMSFNHLHREAQLALVDRFEDRQIHVRYRVAELPSETPVIITTNQSPGFILNLSDKAIARRCLAIDVKGVGQYKVLTF